jgi:hypothetical protein
MIKARPPGVLIRREAGAEPGPSPGIARKCMPAENIFDLANFFYLCNPLQALFLQRGEGSVQAPYVSPPPRATVAAGFQPQWASMISTDTYFVRSFYVLPLAVQ